MGKGFNNYMCKKFFHPASRDNLKRVWMAEQKTEAEQKKQDDLRQQYEREQELYDNRAILSKESKEKLEVNFMYDPPPGARKEDREKKEEEGEVGYKFEWQRKWGTAPRESWAKGDESIKDQPFGICVRNVRCVKCHKYGHINTDKECPMYGKAADSEEPADKMDQSRLIEEMKDDGMKMRWSAWDMENTKQRKYDMIKDPNAKTEEQLEREDRREDEAVRKKMAMIQSMSKEEKKKLLKKLNKMEKQKDKGIGKKSKKEKKHKKRRDSSSSSDDSEDEKKEKRKRRSDSPAEDERKKRSKDDGRRDRKRSSVDSEDERRNRGRKRSESPDRRRDRSQKSPERRRDRRSDSSDDESRRRKRDRDDDRRKSRR
jgi:CBF1 interacting corepressor